MGLFQNNIRESQPRLPAVLKVLRIIHHGICEGGEE